MNSRRCSKLILCSMASRVTPALSTSMSTGPTSACTRATPFAAGLRIGSGGHVDGRGRVGTAPDPRRRPAAALRHRPGPGAPGTWQQLRIGARRDGTLTVISLRSRGTAGVDRGRWRGEQRADLAPVPELRQCAVRRLHRRGAGLRDARAGQYARSSRSGGGDRRTGREGRHEPAGAARPKRMSARCVSRTAAGRRTHQLPGWQWESRPAFIRNAWGGTRLRPREVATPFAQER